MISLEKVPRYRGGLLSSTNVLTRKMITKIDSFLSPFYAILDRLSDFPEDDLQRHLDLIQW